VEGNLGRRPTRVPHLIYVANKAGFESAVRIYLRILTNTLIMHT
jgi:hypothetical protein